MILLIPDFKLGFKLLAWKGYKRRLYKFKQEKEVLVWKAGSGIVGDSSTLRPALNQGRCDRWEELYLIAGASFRCGSSSPLCSYSPWQVLLEDGSSKLPIETVSRPWHPSKLEVRPTQSTMFLSGLFGVRSKFSATILIVLCGLTFLTMDGFLFSLVQRSSGPLPLYFNSSENPCTAVSPFCFLDTKALLLDWTNFYIHQPLASIGVALFEFRNFLDELDGTVAKATHNCGECSLGYYVDGISDLVGTILLLVAMQKFLKNRRAKHIEYSLISVPTSSNGRHNAVKENHSAQVAHCLYETFLSPFKKGANNHPSLTVWVGIQLLINSMSWNRYILLFTKLFEVQSDGLSSPVAEVYLRHPFTYVTFLAWRVFSVHSVVEIVLLSVFFDKMAEMIALLSSLGWVFLSSTILMTELLVYSISRKNLS
ncbi:unnamed protein product [Allacma fusca]|uniref:Ceramide phosphoethanolamine synthase n=1 Tax=Allacma fusca TaxID=39272 RepID=A0A8J2JVG0_9HEXA|nr:unnamed protein product [Allacma fusca]